MKKLFAITIMLASFAVQAEYVCSTQVQIFTGPVGSTDTADSRVTTGSIFRGSVVEECERAHSRYTYELGGLLQDLYPVPEDATVQQQIYSK